MKFYFVYEYFYKVYMNNYNELCIYWLYKHIYNMGTSLFKCTCTSPLRDLDHIRPSLFACIVNLLCFIVILLLCFQVPQRVTAWMSQPHPQTNRTMRTTSAVLTDSQTMYSYALSHYFLHTLWKHSWGDSICYYC